MVLPQKQGIGVKGIYDAKHWIESRGFDTTGTEVLIHTALFSVIVFGSLKQSMLWSGLLKQNRNGIGGSAFFHFLEVCLIS